MNLPASQIDVAEIAAVENDDRARELAARVIARRESLLLPVLEMNAEELGRQLVSEIIKRRKLRAANVLTCTECGGLTLAINDKRPVRCSKCEVIQ